MRCIHLTNPVNNLRRCSCQTSAIHIVIRFGRLLLRRIEDARKRLLDENDAVVADVLKAAEASPKIVELRALKQAYAARQEQIKTLEKERGRDYQSIRKGCGGISELVAVALITISLPMKA